MHGHVAPQAGGRPAPRLGVVLVAFCILGAVVWALSPGSGVRAPPPGQPVWTVHPAFERDPPPTPIPETPVPTCAPSVTQPPPAAPDRPKSPRIMIDTDPPVPIDDLAPAELLDTRTHVPCLTAKCARRGYTQFRHYELCLAATHHLRQLQLGSRHDMGDAMRLDVGGGSGKGSKPPRTAFEQQQEATCDTAARGLHRQLRRADLAACIDPRFPLRVPLSMHRLQSGPLLACYARGDMVCDIVGRSGGWESELTYLLVFALRAARTRRISQLTAHFHTRARQLRVGVPAAVLAAEDAQRQARYDAFLAARDARNATAQAAADGDYDFELWEHLRVYEDTAGVSADGALKRRRSTHDSEADFDPMSHAKNNFDVEYLDVGGNVGSFLYHVWRFGFPATAFEALAHNMQLLSTSMCLNGLRKPLLGPDAATPARPSVVEAATAATSARPSGVDSPVTVYHTALGREANVRCVMMSEELNFGDTWISCNATHVNSKSDRPFQKYVKRGYVNMTTLDSLIMDGTVVHEARRRRALVARADKVLAAMQARLEAAAKASGATAAAADASAKPPVVAPLPDDYFTKDYVMKIDVEGHEVAVMEGASRLLASAARPALVVSEVWKTLNITRYGELMIGAGYVGHVPADLMWLNTVEDARKYHTGLKRGMDTVLWVRTHLVETLLPMYVDRTRAPTHPPATTKAAGAGTPQGTGVLAPVPERV